MLSGCSAEDERGFKSPCDDSKAFGISLGSAHTAPTPSGSSASSFVATGDGTELSSALTAESEPGPLSSILLRSGALQIDDKGTDHYHTNRQKQKTIVFCSTQTYSRGPYNRGLQQGALQQGPYSRGPYNRGPTAQDPQRQTLNSRPGACLTGCTMLGSI